MFSSLAYAVYRLNVPAALMAYEAIAAFANGREASVYMEEASKTYSSTTHFIVVYGSEILYHCRGQKAEV